MGGVRIIGRSGVNRNVDGRERVEEEDREHVEETYMEDTVGKKKKEKIEINRGIDDGYNVGTGGKGRGDRC